MFAWLTMRHVGDAAFLEDQVDQLQNFESLLRLRPEGLWGAIMSGTVPPARALGPLGAVVFGVPVSLGLGVNAIHVATSLLIAVATAVCFVALARIELTFAWCWLLIFSATGLVWWNAAMLWSNTVLLPVGLLFAALAASCLYRPDRATLGWMVVVAMFALQLHLVAAVALPIAVTVAIVTYRRGRPASRLTVWMLALAMVIAIGPYLLGEALSGLANTRAILGHLGSSDPAAGDNGSATASLAIALDPTRLLEALGLGPWTAIVVGAVLSIVALRLLRASSAGSAPLFWLAVCAVAGIAGQALFFLWMSRPFAGYHHVTLLAPFYAVVPAALLTRLLGQWKPVAIGTAVLALLIWMGPTLADRHAEETPWSYARIRASLDALCGSAAVATDEGQAFAAQLNPHYDSVLRYMMKRGMTTCRYQPSSDVLIAATRDAQYPTTKTIGGSTFYRELVLPPGIARYRRTP
jgi:hypothetical protein